MWISRHGHFTGASHGFCRQSLGGTECMIGGNAARLKGIQQMVKPEDLLRMPHKLWGEFFR
jgi:hypothetical protein